MRYVRQASVIAGFIKGNKSCLTTVSFMRVVIAVTGASGAIYAKRLLEALKQKSVTTDLIVSPTAAQIIEQELEISLEVFGSLASRQHKPNDFSSPLASGSCRVDATVVIPCSMKTLAAAANGFAENLISRAIDVTIKEKRKLILVPREAPLSAIHLENMLILSRLGAFIIPACPGFYHSTKGINDLADFVVAKVMDALCIEHDFFDKVHWTHKPEE